MNRSALDAVLVPPAVVTVTSTVPVPAGDVTVHTVPVPQSTAVARFGPKWTADGAPRSLPMMVTTVDPVAGPDDGRTELTTGGGTT